MSTKTLKNNVIDLEADFYEKNSGLQNNLARDIISSYQINPYAHVLDIGCGDGKITAELSKLADRGFVLGIDSSRSMIEFASSNFPESKYPNLQFIQKEAEKLKLSRKLDLVVSFSCFQWLREPEAAFQRMSNALNDNGEVIILTYPRESYYYKFLARTLKDYPEYEMDSAYHTMLSIEEYDALIRRNNLEIISFEKKELFATYNSQNEIQDFIKGWLNSYVPLPEDLHQDFLDKVCKAIKEDPKTQKNGKTVVPYTALIIRAKKK